MKIKNLVTLTLLIGFVLCLLSSSSLFALMRNQEKKPQESKPTYIPKEVKAVFEKDMQTRQARPDIPFSIIRALYFPTAQQSLHTVFLIKIKNDDLGFAPIAQQPGAQEKKKEKEEALSAFESVSAKLQTRSHVFIQLNRLVNGAPGEVAYEIYVPANLQVDGSAYEPDKEELYSVGYPFLPGNYLVSMAITSQKLEKIGTQYFELSLPDQASLTELDATPLFFFKNMPDMPSPETRAITHKGYFTYSVLQFEPNLEGIFSPGQNLELFFYVFGAQPGEGVKYNLEVDFEVLKGEEKVIRWAPGTYQNPLINQPLPLEKTVLIKSESGEKTEKRALEPGKYTLSLTITDKVSEKSVTKTIDFEVRQSIS